MAARVLDRLWHRLAIIEPAAKSLPDSPRFHALRQKRHVPLARNHAMTSTNLARLRSQRQSDQLTTAEKIGFEYVGHEGA